ncbi:MAG: FAD-dependent oxidoreductase, partial [Bacteroidales bacterium]|nr:FAD-dependent oxidoreductase [Bacteroidales bacterium]
MNHDIIIIGAGLGGLTAGANLAKQGKKVLLIEQHDRPGGCATTFTRK